MRTLRALGIAVLVLSLSVSCARTGPQAPSGTPQAPAQAPAPPPGSTISVVPTASPAAVATGTIPRASAALTLTWWTPEFISPKASQPSGALMERYLAEFEQANRGQVRVAPVVKARYGKGGLLDYLRTTPSAAPGLLPDLVALDLAELEQAAALGLLRPLDTLLDRSLIADLYPFARQAGQLGDKLMAIPFAVDVEHAIYATDKVPKPVSTWAELLANNVVYAFPASAPSTVPAGGPTDDVQHTFISQYLSAGATLDPKTRQMTIEEQPLLRLLSFYRDARNAKILAPDMAEASSLDAIWAAFVRGKVPMTIVSARRFLANQETLQKVGFAAMPGFAGPAPSVASGWGLAITAEDPARQRAAAAFITWLIQPERAGEWTQAAGWLPASPRALAMWGNDPYTSFLDGQLASAVAHPIGPDYPQVVVRLQKAVAAVLEGTLTPAEATRAALSPR